MPAGDKRYASDIEALAATARKEVGQALPAAEAPAAIGAASSTAHKQEVAGVAGDGGADNSDRTEVDFAQRTYYAGKYYKSTDGLILIPASRRYTFTKESGATQSDEYASPP